MIITQIVLWNISQIVTVSSTLIRDQSGCTLQWTYPGPHVCVFRVERGIHLTSLIALIEYCLDLVAFYLASTVVTRRNHRWRRRRYRRCLNVLFLLRATRAAYSIFLLNILLQDDVLALVLELSGLEHAGPESAQYLLPCFQNHPHSFARWSSSLNSCVPVRSLHAYWDSSRIANDALREPYETMSRMDWKAQ